MAVMLNKLRRLPTAKPAVPRRRRSEEASHQKAFFQWLSLYDKHIRGFTFHIPNGGSRDIREARSLKSQGVTSGVPDIFCAIPVHGAHGLWIEMKSKKGVLTESQKEMINNLSRVGYIVEIAYSWFEARDILLEYLNGHNHVKRS